MMAVASEFYTQQKPLARPIRQRFLLFFPLPFMPLLPIAQE